MRGLHTVRQACARSPARRRGLARARPTFASITEMPAPVSRWHKRKPGRIEQRLERLPAALAPADPGQHVHAHTAALSHGQRAQSG